MFEKKFRVTGNRWSTEQRYYDWDIDHKYPTYDLIEEKKFDEEITGSVIVAEKWLLDNHPDYYFGANIKQINGDDFAALAVPDYYENLYGTTDRNDILAQIKADVDEKYDAYMQEQASAKPVDYTNTTCVGLYRNIDGTSCSTVDVMTKLRDGSYGCKDYNGNTVILDDDSIMPLGRQYSDADGVSKGYFMQLQGKENRIGLVFDISREDKFVVAYMTDTHTVEKYSSDKANYFYNQRSFDAIMAMNDDVYKHRLSIIDMRDNSSNRHSVPSWMSDIDEKSDEIVSDLDYDN